ncbi:MAG TPA: hypothetical protein VHR15_15795 [Ktedonobacterales bacterium]|nr:hypothetical protein [Ktedonobacterales bacterium]
MPPANRDDNFSAGLDTYWSITRPGGGLVEVVDSNLRLELSGAVAGAYSDAQIDDYSGRARPTFPWRPPLKLTIRARFSHLVHPVPTVGADANQQLLRGTVGFGFWNYPLSLTGAVLRLPDAIWFFGASQPSNMALVPGIPGWGWKAQVVHAHRLGAVAASGPTALSALWGRLSGHEEAAARWIQRLTGAQEARLMIDPREWVTYEIDWRPEHAIFRANGAAVLIARNPPPGPLGFVAWVDNQYAIATPRGELRFGTVASEREWLELAYIRIHATDR